MFEARAKRRWFVINSPRSGSGELADILALPIDSATLGAFSAEGQQ